LGIDGVDGDVEIMSLMMECLKQVGLRSFKVTIGHMGFFQGLLLRAGLSAEGRRRAEQAAARKDLPLLEELLVEERVSKSSAAKILEALGLCGDRRALDRGRRLAGNDRTLNRALDRLADVYARVALRGQRDMVLVDLGEFRGFEYYDGIVFDVFAGGVGAELGGGGRYDHLLGRFGIDRIRAGR
jgi:ATP phosphoribosyltransferase regulatory subunit